MLKIFYVVGDNHGSFDDFAAAVGACDRMLMNLYNGTRDKPFPTEYKVAPSAVLSVGDFGWKFEDSFTKQFVNLSCPVYFVEGNHDDYYYLRDAGCGDGVTKIASNLYHIGRGHVVDIDGVKIAGCGGAVSIDRGHRVLGDTWWIEEEVTEEDYDTALKNKQKVDIFLSHDAPGTYPELRAKLIESGIKLKPSVINKCVVNRHMVKKIADVFEPRIRVHGHYHNATSEVKLHRSKQQDYGIVGLHMANVVGGCGIIAVFDSSEEINMNPACYSIFFANANGLGFAYAR